MLTLSRILLPVDFSEPGAGAARTAIGLARHFDAELTMLHVNELYAQIPSGVPGPIDTGWITALEANRRRELEAYFKEECAGLRVQRVVSTGDPAPTIVEHARSAGLVVMPTHGYGPFRRFLLGSVTAKVLHDVSCPVWTGAHLRDISTQPWKPARHVLCAVDLSAATEPVMRWAYDFAARMRASITLLHVIPTQSEWAEQAREQLLCLQKKLGFQGAIEIVEGDPAHTISGGAERLGSDLVVIGRSVDEGRLREIAYQIIRESPYPVVSV